mmetsp:Transcript_25624/g.53992  ORF Transcript_25624/g.53992 Transcript_25624/m.53992 type:complete len:100 (-) Transcript_25624:362-661(-)
MGEPRTWVETKAAGVNISNGDMRRITSLVRIVMKQNLESSLRNFCSHRIMRSRMLSVCDKTEEAGLLAIHREEDVDCESSTVDGFDRVCLLLHRRSHGS